jgi:hypothetical protein
MDFSVELFAGEGKKSNPNTAKISIYNLKEDTRNLFSEEHQVIEFYAGHGDDIQMIFSGQTTSVTHVKGNTFYRTDIAAGDGVKDFTTKKISKSYAAGTPSAVVLSDILVAFGMPFVIDPTATSTIAGEVLLQSETYSGMAKDVLNTFTADNGLEWSIQYGTVEVTTRNDPFLADPTGAVISSDTGMIEVPEIIVRTKQDNKNTYGIRVKSLLNPEIKPKRLFTIAASNTLLGQISELITDAPPTDGSGNYVADTVKFFGNNYGGDFYVEVEGDKYG